MCDRGFGTPAHPTPGFFHWVLYKSETRGVGGSWLDECPWLQHCPVSAPVWVLGLPLQSQESPEELGSADGSEREFEKVVPFVSMMID